MTRLLLYALCCSLIAGCPSTTKAVRPHIPLAVADTTNAGHRSLLLPAAAALLVAEGR